MKVATQKFVAWLMGLTVLARYLVIAVLFHVLLLFGLASIKIVAYVPKIIAAFSADSLPPPIEAEPDPFAAYRDFDYEGPTTGGGAGTGKQKGPGGSPTAGGTPGQYEAAILKEQRVTQPTEAQEVIGVLADASAGIVRPAGTPVTATVPGLGIGEVKLGTVGVQGPGGNLYGGRMGAVRSQNIAKFKGSQQAEQAVLAALRWLKANQRPDGSWKCEQSDSAGTAMALLAFLGHGETVDSPEFGQCVQRALQYLVTRVGPNGLVTGVSGNPFGYTQGIVAYALGEAYALSGSPALKEPVERATGAIVRWQRSPRKTSAHNGGWRYTPTSDNSDVSVTGWMIMALKSAKNAGIDVPQDAFDKASNYLWNMYGEYHDDAKNDTFRGFGYERPGVDPGPTAIGVLCQQFMGHGNDTRLREALRYLRTQKVDWQSAKGLWLLYTWYYATQAMFQAGGDHWIFWNQQIRDATIRAQNENGSWPLPAHSEWEQKSLSKSQVYPTALGALILEVYYRYLPLYQLMEQQQEKPSGPATATR
jgi:hypothetical protein